MSNKFGKFLLATAALSTAAVAAYHFLQKKDSALANQEEGDDDYDDFSDPLDEESETPSRSYVSLNPEESSAKDAPIEAEENISIIAEPVVETELPDTEIPSAEEDADFFVEETIVEEADAEEIITEEADIEEANAEEPIDIETAENTDTLSDESSADTDETAAPETEYIEDITEDLIEEPVMVNETPITAEVENPEAVAEILPTEPVKQEEVSTAVPLAPNKDAEDEEEETLALTEAINALVEEMNSTETLDDDFFVEETITEVAPVADIPTTTVETTPEAPEPTVSPEEDTFVEETESDSFSPLSGQVNTEETIEEFFNDEEEEL
ncbi:MAG: hypothetical protein IJX63_01265 [Lachnospiraceae bacterium]|nr:hypothetical protein [Lachnospiraceae bacterium]